MKSGQMLIDFSGISSAERVGDDGNEIDPYENKIRNF